MSVGMEAIERADALEDAGSQKKDAGDEAGALAAYLEALALHRERPTTLYNVGLIYKYRRDWQSSLRYNRMAIEYDPTDVPTNWNLAIAATALRDWRTAREAWQRLGIELDDQEGPIVDDFGYAPVRLNGFEDRDSAVEVVWARRLSPVTARIDNIPTLAAKFRYGDVVLHDGAGTGTRLDADGREKPVFNVLELFEPSPYVTYQASIDAPDKQAVEALAAAFESAGIECEDWTANMHLLCKACSEGGAHEQHDHHIPPSTDWRVARLVGVAARDPARVEAVLKFWSAGDPTRRVESLET
jgi:tetratricopeptide (TPR) repeat protein